MEAPKFKYGNKWSLFHSELNRYFEKQRLDECQKSGVLLLNICPKTLSILKSLCSPRTPNTMKYGQLCQKLNKKFAPKISDYRERVIFYDLKQMKNESVKKWWRRVQHAATSCNFGKFLDEKVKDKFVTGLCKGPVLDRLFEESPKLNINEMLNVALRAETLIKSETPSVHRKTPSAATSNPSRINTADDTFDTDSDHYSNNSSTRSSPSPDREHEPSTSNVEPCRICGAPCSGTRYGVVACAGCGQFFRRIITSETTYVKCYNQGLCKDVLCCRECRFKKCISKGMKLGYRE